MAITAEQQSLITRRLTLMLGVMTSVGISKPTQFREFADLLRVIADQLDANPSLQAEIVQWSKEQRLAGW